MKDYSEFHLEDFLNDPDFLDWVHAGAELKGTPWEELLKDYPQKRQELLQAKSIIQNWKTETATLSEPERVAGIKAIMSDIEERSSVPLSPPFFRLRSWKFAAAAAVLIVAGWGVWQKRIAENRYSYEVLVENASAPLTEISNDGQDLMLVALPDSSKVTLSPGSKLSYSDRFTLDSTRTVILKGEAFFKVVRDVSHPFLVFSSGITTRVLGTSFRVCSGDDRVSVEVTSGQVAVARIDERVKDNLVLSANDKAIFSADENILTKGLADNPVVIAGNEELNNFQFDETPLASIFDLLQKSYGIEIIYDKEAFTGCNLTIPLNKEPFFTKLDIICNTVKARYDIVDNKVIVTGGGGCD